MPSVEPLTYTRWDPSSRAGAVAVRSTGLKNLRTLTDSVSAWASYQNLAGDMDTVETSAVQGIYDWRAYIREETQIARRREEKKPASKPERAAPAPAPTVFYA